MKILFIVTSFNGLTQRAWVELDRLNHQVKVHTTSTNEKMIEAVTGYQPDLIIAPYLKKAIPDEIWKNYTCLIVHPGIPGDRGSSSLDWAILNSEKEWGVTIIQAVEKLDSGHVWAAENFAMRNVSKSFLYRHEVTEAAIKALLKAIDLFEKNNIAPKAKEDTEKKGKWNRSTHQNDFKFLWTDDTASIIKKINAADSFPGALCSILDEEFLCYGVKEEDVLKGIPGQILAQRNNAVCMATKDSALWIQCLKKHNVRDSIKLPAAIVLGR